MNSEEIIDKWNKINTMPQDAGLEDVMKISGFSTKAQLLNFMRKYSEYNFHNTEHFYEFCERCENIFRYHKTANREVEKVKGEAGIYLIKCVFCMKYNYNPPAALTLDHMREQLSDELNKTLHRRFEELEGLENV